jgi:succinoglycan biosynthesis protein ExoA
VRQAAQAGLVAYALTLLGTSVGAVPRAGARDAAGLPLVFATMHLSWGVGFLAGCAKEGPPGEAIAGAARRAVGS